MPTSKESPPCHVPTITRSDASRPASLLDWYDPKTPEPSQTPEPSHYPSESPRLVRLPRRRNQPLPYILPVSFSYPIS